MADDGNRQVAVTLDQVAIALGLNPQQFEALDLKLGGIDDAIHRLAENVSAGPDTSVAGELILLREEIQSLKEVMSVGFTDVRQLALDLNSTIFTVSNNLAKWLAAIALAAADPANNTAEVQKLIDKNAAEIRTAKETLQSSIDRNQPKGE